MEKRRLIKNIDIYTDTVSVWEYGFTCGVEKTWYIYFIMDICLIVYGKDKSFYNFCTDTQVPSGVSCTYPYVYSVLFDRNQIVFYCNFLSNLIEENQVNFWTIRCSTITVSHFSWNHAFWMHFCWIIRNNIVTEKWENREKWRKKKTLCLPWLVWCHPFRLVVNTKCNF